MNDEGYTGILYIINDGHSFIYSYLLKCKLRINNVTPLESGTFGVFEHIHKWSMCPSCAARISKTHPSHEEAYLLLLSTLPQCNGSEDKSELVEAGGTDTSLTYTWSI